MFNVNSLSLSFSVFRSFVRTLRLRLYFSLDSRDCLNIVARCVCVIATRLFTVMCFVLLNRILWLFVRLLRFAFRYCFLTFFPTSSFSVFIFIWFFYSLRVFASLSLILFYVIFCSVFFVSCMCVFSLLLLFLFSFFLLLSTFVTFSLCCFRLFVSLFCCCVFFPQHFFYFICFRVNMLCVFFFPLLLTLLFTIAIPWN